MKIFPNHDLKNVIICTQSSSMNISNEDLRYYSERLKSRSVPNNPLSSHRLRYLTISQVQKKDLPQTHKTSWTVLVLKKHLMFFIAPYRYCKGFYFFIFYFCHFSCIIDYHLWLLARGMDDGFFFLVGYSTRKVAYLVKGIFPWLTGTLQGWDRAYIIIIIIYALLYNCDF